MNEIKDAFSKGSKDYDKYRKQTIPYMDVFYDTVVELTEEFEKPKILDLGAGTGILSEKLHKKHPESSITLLDISKEMLEISREKFKDIKTFEYLEADYLNCEFNSEYDIVVSSLSIHHLEDEDKKFLYKKVYDTLSSGGVFINADEVVGLTKGTEKMYKIKDATHLAKQDMPESDKDVLRERRKLDKPATLLENIQWFNNIGYSNTDIFFKYYRYFVIYGEK